MKNKSFIGPSIDALKPKGRPGAKPVVTPCPYCGLNMSQTSHAEHRKGCKKAFQNAPPQPADLMHDSGGGYRNDRSFPQT